MLLKIVNELTQQVIKLDNELKDIEEENKSRSDILTHDTRQS